MTFSLELCIFSAAAALCIMSTATAAMMLLLGTAASALPISSARHGATCFHYVERTAAAHRHAHSLIFL